MKIPKQMLRTGVAFSAVLGVSALFAVLYVNIQAQSAITTGVNSFSCGDAEASISSSIGTITVGGSNYYIGTQQVSAINQNPIVAKFTGGVQDWCRTDYESTPVDGRGLGLLATPAGDVYAYFSVDGGGAFNFGASNGWLNSYGSGGGAKISVISLLDTTNGDPTEGTFIRSELDDGSTNSLEIVGLQWDDTNQEVEVQALAFFRPLDVNGNQLTVTTSSPFDYVVELAANLRSANNAFLGTFAGGTPNATGSTATGNTQNATSSTDTLIRTGALVQNNILIVGLTLIIGAVAGIIALALRKAE